MCLLYRLDTHFGTLLKRGSLLYCELVCAQMVYGQLQRTFDLIFYALHAVERGSVDQIDRYVLETRFGGPLYSLYGVVRPV